MEFGPAVQLPFDGCYLMCGTMRLNAQPFKEHLMPSKKKSKGVLRRIGEAATSAAEVVIDAGSKAIHAVGEMIPTGSSQKGPKSSSKASKRMAPKASGRSAKARPKAVTKASRLGSDSKTKSLGPKPAKPGMKKPAPAKPVTRVAKAAPKRDSGKKR
jgi:hypothetical protein